MYDNIIAVEITLLSK